MAMAKEIKLVDSVETLEAKIAEIREAQKIFSTYTQEQVDKIFKAAALAANKARIPLAKMAVEETGMGIVEDKVIKNNYASEHIYNKYRNTQTYKRGKSRESCTVRSPACTRWIFWLGSAVRLSSGWPCISRVRTPRSSARTRNTAPPAGALQKTSPHTWTHVFKTT